MLRTLSGTLLLAGALLAAGCDNDVENATGPGTAAPTTTDTYSGTINRNGAATHTFTVAASGVVTATLTEVTPDPAIAIGFVLGTWNGTSCQAVLSKDDTVQGQALIGSVGGVGTLCVRVHDPNGKLNAALNYKVSVEHP